MIDTSLCLSRRKVIGLLSTASAAVVAGSSSASAFLFRRPAAAEVDFEQLPEEWVNRQGGNLNNYIDYIANLNLQKITLHQVVSAHAKQRGAVWNSLPPQSLWRYIGTTLKVVDRIAREIDKPLKEVVSAYRSPAYNARCPGAKSSSWHQSNCAMDVTFATAAPVIARTMRSYRNRGLFRGGVGSYSAFTHIDTRGTNVDW